MTDTIQQINPAPAPEISVDPSAVAAAPTINPQPTPVAVTPEPTPAPVAEAPAPVVEAKPETVLGEAPAETPKPEAKVEKTPEATPAPEQKTEGQSDEPASPPTYDAFTLPEGVSLDQERVGKFTEILGKLELEAKADHALIQKFGQDAVDFHVQELQRAVEDLTKSYQTSWERQKTEWKDSFMTDPEIGGNRFQTTVDAARNSIRTYGGTAEQQAEFRQVMETSGLGNHPAVIRLLANVGKAMEEGRPLASVRPAQQPKSRVSAMYGQNTQ